MLGGIWSPTLCSHLNPIVAPICVAKGAAAGPERCLLTQTDLVFGQGHSGSPPNYADMSNWAAERS